MEKSASKNNWAKKACRNSTVQRLLFCASPSGVAAAMASVLVECIVLFLWQIKVHYSKKEIIIMRLHRNYLSSINMHIICGGYASSSPSAPSASHHCTVCIFEWVVIPPIVSSWLTSPRTSCYYRFSLRYALRSTAERFDPLRFFSLLLSYEHT